MESTACYCGSKKSFEECCQPLIEFQQKAETAEQLMRSRYTAFATKTVDYLVETHHPKTRVNLDIHDLFLFCGQAKFTKLKVKKTKKGQATDQNGRVKFEAFFTMDGKQEVIAEDSYFERIDGQWYYMDAR
ncbi:SEC-C motif-containing protein [Lishizhenia tianjinensis]|uniref:SEC-C motif-containing protein n=1 Tax=Lishizhenia tianjinensis TaxID=477690 RepID=A0A1I6XZT6_9FLAO|nr:YchJ family metal-binding protein [Lishizhenia tianjinensis]SFT43471.1 SEC-C motif-containing protein [Lishizhenia tianjinensis]